MGSSGGGGGAGTVDYPDYMKTVHGDWLNAGGADAIEESVTEVMNSALGSSPWSGVTAYPVVNDIDAYMATIDAFTALLAGIDELVDWDKIYNQVLLSIGSYSELAVADITAMMVPDVIVEDIDPIDDLVVADVVAVADIAVVDADGVTDAEIVNDVDAFADQLDDEIANKILPRFRRGMQDIGAVVSSSFAVGEACIEGFRNRDVSRHASTLRLNAAMKNADVGVSNMNKDYQVAKSNQDKDLQIAVNNQDKNTQVGISNLNKSLSIATADQGKDVQVGLANLNKSLGIATSNQGKDIKVGDINLRTDSQYKTMFIEASSQILQLMIQRIAWENDLTKISVEANRIKVVAMKEMAEANNEYVENDALWDLEVFQYGANVLASIGGGVAVQAKKKSNKAASALGGAMSGAASGAMIGAAYGSAYAGYGAVVGAVLGAAIGLMSS